MSNLQAFVDSKRREFAQHRRQARYFTLAGLVFRFVLAPLLLFTGGLKGIALLPDVPVFNVPRLARVLSIGIYEHIPMVWSFLWGIAPYPRGAEGSEYFVSLLGWIGWFYGLFWLGSAFLHRAERLRTSTTRAENVLNDHIQQIQMSHLQSPPSSHIEVSGDINVISAMNTVNNVSGFQEKPSWWLRPVGIILLGLLVNIISGLVVNIVSKLFGK